MIVDFIVIAIYSKKTIIYVHIVSLTNVTGHESILLFHFILSFSSPGVTIIILSLI